MDVYPAGTNGIQKGYADGDYDFGAFDQDYTIHIDRLIFGIYLHDDAQFDTLGDLQITNPLVAGIYTESKH